MLRRSRLLVTALLLVVASLPAQAGDLTIVSQVTASKGKPMTSTQYVTAGKVRTSDGQSDVIVDLESGRIVQIEHAKKRYSESTFEEIQAHFAELEQLLRDNPMMARMFGAVTEVQVEKTAETRKVAGYTCRRYNLSVGQSFHFEVWATDELEPPMELYDAQKLLYAQMGPVATRFEKMFDEMKKIGGMSLMTRIDSRIMGMGISSTSEATEVKKSVPADAFDIPAGYKKTKSPYAK